MNEEELRELAKGDTLEYDHDGEDGQYTCTLCHATMPQTWSAYANEHRERPAWWAQKVFRHEITCPVAMSRATLGPFFHY